MRKLLRGGIAALAGLFLFTPLASAKRIALPPLTDWIARADCIVVGKVASLENKTIKTAMEGELGVANVKIETALVGAKGLTHIKVGYRPGLLMADQEACLFLYKSSVENVYLVRNLQIFHKSDNEQYKQQVGLIKRCAGLLEDPLKGLKSKDAEDRLLSAALLLGKYRPQFTAAEKLELIDAEESKLLLEVLAGADWSKYDSVARINAPQLFSRLGLNETDGWKEPANFMDRNDLAKKWLKDNAGKVRVKRFVFGKE